MGGPPYLGIHPPAWPRKPQQSCRADHIQHYSHAVPLGRHSIAGNVQMMSSHQTAHGWTGAPKHHHDWESLTGRGLISRGQRLRRAENTRVEIQMFIPDPYLPPAAGGTWNSSRLLRSSSHRVQPTARDGGDKGVLLSLPFSKGSPSGLLSCGLPDAVKTD